MHTASMSTCFDATDATAGSCGGGDTTTQEGEMNWLQRWKARRAQENQTITLELSPEEWKELQTWSRPFGWTTEYMITRWCQDRMHGIGRIGN